MQGEVRLDVLTFKYSQTSVQRPPLGPPPPQKKNGRCSEVVVVVTQWSGSSYKQVFIWAPWGSRKVVVDKRSLFGGGC